MPILNNVATAFTSLYGLAGLTLLGVGIYWLFNKKARQAQLAELRKRLDELQPTDPEYNQVRALYTSMMIDAQRWDFFHHSDSGDMGHHSDSGSHSSGDYGDSGHSHGD